MRISAALMLFGLALSAAAQDYELIASQQNDGAGSVASTDYTASQLFEYTNPAGSQQGSTDYQVVPALSDPRAPSAAGEWSLYE